MLNKGNNNTKYGVSVLSRDEERGISMGFQIVFSTVKMFKICGPTINTFLVLNILSSDTNTIEKPYRTIMH